jgi:glyoxylase-like metal-dependent hydrolase (beta-lactamase superfamily II)
MFVSGFSAGAWGTNCYVLASGPGEACVIIDPGQDSITGVQDIIREHRLLPAAVLLTHGHIDHVWSVAPLTTEFEVPAVIHSADRYRLADPAGTSMVAAREQLMAMTKNALELTEPSEIRVLDGDGSVEIAGMEFGVHHAPGHTEGSTVFTVIGDRETPLMLSGDVLFAGSIGRTDLPGGNPAAMRATLERVILPQPDETEVLPGHGELTTIGAERASNPFLRDLNLAGERRPGL